MGNEYQLLWDKVKECFIGLSKTVFCYTNVAASWILTIMRCCNLHTLTFPPGWVVMTKLFSFFPVVHKLLSYVCGCSLPVFPRIPSLSCSPHFVLHFPMFTLLYKSYQHSCVTIHTTVPIIWPTFLVEVLLSDTALCPGFRFIPSCWFLTAL
jgi:hypothetical protein